MQLVKNDRLYHRWYVYLKQRLFFYCTSSYYLLPIIFTLVSIFQNCWGSGPETWGARTWHQLVVHDRGYRLDSEILSNAGNYVNFVIGPKSSERIVVRPKSSDTQRGRVFLIINGLDFSTSFRTSSGIVNRKLGERYAETRRRRYVEEFSHSPICL